MNKLTTLMNELFLSMLSQQKFEFKETPLIQDEIMKAVCKALSLEVEAVVSQRRLTDLVQARQIIAYLLAKNTPLSYRAIGTFLGGRDHSTAIHACNAVQDYIDTKNKLFLMKMKLVSDELEDLICS